MENQNQIVSTNYEITEAGKAVLGALRGEWGTEVVIKDKTRLNEDGVAGIYPTEVVIDTKIKRLNRGLSKEVFHELAAYIKPEHCDRFSQIIKNGTFEVSKALQVLKVAPMVANLDFQPDDWEEAQSIDSPTFSTFCKYRGDETAKRFIIAMLIELSEDFGRRSDITKESSVSIANRLLGKVKSLTLAELKLCFNMLRNQPQRISNLDAQTTINFVKAFASKKTELAQKQSEGGRSAFSDSPLEVVERYEERRNRELRFDEVMKYYK